jgi:hypothetical protein
MSTPFKNTTARDFNYASYETIMPSLLIAAILDHEHAVWVPAGLHVYAL